MRIQSIQSAHNSIIKQAIALKNKKARDIAGLYIAEGVRTCSTLFRSPHTLIRCIMTEDMRITVEQYTIPEIVVVPPELMKKISATETPSGLMGVFQKPQRPIAPLGPGLVLAQISDPGNMGTLIRTAAALNATTVVIVEGCDPWSPKVVQASAGTIGMISLYELSWQQLLHLRGSISLGALVTNAGISISDISSLHQQLLVVGNEAHGLPEEWESTCDIRITLPMPGQVESLNAAVAGSIALYVAYLQK